MVLKEKEINWGPKPFWMMRCWEEMEEYAVFVKTEWKSMNVVGWKGFALKEKLKKLKSKLKAWNKEHVGNLEAKIKEAKEELFSLDLKGENDGLTVEEVRRRRMCTSNIHKLSSMNCSFLWQKSRMRWLKAGMLIRNFFIGVFRKGGRLMRFWVLSLRVI